MIVGTRALIIDIVLLAIIFFMIYGFFRRKAYAFDLSIGFFSFAALNAFVSLTLFESSENAMFKKLLLLSFISLILMNIVIVWYILHEKKYFFAEKFKDRPMHERDKIFLYVIISFWTIALLIGVTIGYQFYKDTKMLIDQTVVELHGDYYKGQIICEEKEGLDKDVCMLIIATAQRAENRPKAELYYLCDSIQSDFFRFTCVRSIAQ
jgi:hypothetical protein